MTVLNLQDPRRLGRDPGLPRLLGERLCLNFANSIEDPIGEQRHDFLQGYPDLLRWGRHVGMLGDAQAARLREEAERQPDEAGRVYRRALALRDAIDRAFRAISGGETPATPDLATIQEAHLSGLAHARLTAVDGGFAFAWAEDEPHLERVLWPVAQSAVDLLLTGDPARVKRCNEAHGGCSWLFYDVSKNGTRRWCSMEGCGSRVKMSRYHARKRAARA